MYCELCEREKELTAHHLIPKVLHKRLKKKYDKEELNETVDFCRDCHSQVHKFFSEKELGTRLNTLELLQAEPCIQKFVIWVKKQTSKVNMKGIHRK